MSAQHTAAAFTRLCTPSTDLLKLAGAMQPLAEADLHSTVLVQDGPDSPGAFLVAHALRLALGGAAGPTGTAASRRVVLLAAAQAAGHYTAVLRKAGLNLAALVAADRLAVVDLLPLVASAAPGPPPSLSALHQRLAVAVAGSGGGSGGGGLAGSICLVVDDLTVRPAGGLVYVPSAAGSGHLKVKGSWCARGPFVPASSTPACVPHPPTYAGAALPGHRRRRLDGVPTGLRRAGRRPRLLLCWAGARRRA